MSTSTDMPQDSELRQRQSRPTAGELNGSKTTSDTPTLQPAALDSTSDDESVSAQPTKTYGRTPDGTGTNMSSC